MQHYFKYFGVICRHKYFVWTFGRQVGVNIWRLVRHDMHKFSKDEFFAYANKFYGPKSKDDNSASVDARMSRAWLHHFRHQLGDHHFEHWVIPGGKPIPMPEQCIREMVSDWLAASTAYSGSTPTSLDSWNWYQGAKERIAGNTDPGSLRRAEEILSAFFASQTQ